jgi:hypothetical protein
VWVIELKLLLDIITIISVEVYTAKLCLVVSERIRTRSRKDLEGRPRPEVSNLLAA